IQRDIEDPKKKRKAELCAARASEKKASGVSPYLHRCGRHGYDGIIREFEIAFDRTPNLSELQYARMHGLEEPLLKTRTTREGGLLQPSASENASDATGRSEGSSNDGNESSDESEGSLKSDSKMEHSV
ncbi:hypothetical protein KC19_VG244000, partial [Ceratodon purpureus]